MPFETTFFPTRRWVGMHSEIFRLLIAVL